MLVSVFPRDGVNFLYFAHKHAHHTLPIEEVLAEARSEVATKHDHGL